MANSSKKLAMTWTEKKDIILMRQMASEGIFVYKAGSRERGNVWQSIARQLNEEDGFEALTTRGARDRFTLLLRRQKAKNCKELKGTGIGGKEQSEFDLLIEELVELSDESDKRFQEEVESGVEKANNERQKAVDIRKQAMETMGQTKKRKVEQDDDEVKEKKRRRSGSDTMVWLERKAELDAEYKEKQIEEQRAEREERREEHRQELELQKMNFENQMKAQQDQQQQQSMLIQQMMAMMSQQQQQMQTMFARLNK